MSLTEKTAYLRGLADGMKLNENPTDEAKLLLAMADVLNEIAVNVEANNESINAIADELDELDDVVSSLEEALLEGEDDGENGEDDGEDDEEEIVEYELECPNCGKPVVLDEETIEQGEVVCPHCEEKLTIDIGFEDDEEE